MLLNSLFKHWSYRIFAPGVLLRQTYEAFKELLKQDGRCHDLMAEIELLYHDGKRLDAAGINQLYSEFSGAVAAMVDHLSPLHPTEAATLSQYYKKIDFYARFLLAPPEQLPVEPYIIGLSDTDSPSLSGNKAYNLARLQKELQARIPEGFVISANAFNRVLLENNLRAPVDDLLAAIDIEDMFGLQQISGKLTALITSAEIPGAVSESILLAYEQMEKQAGAPVLCAVRSSAVNEDGEHSFAGQYHTELAVGKKDILAAYLKVLASKYSPEALLYRITLGLSDEEAAMGVLVLSMVKASVSGVVYTTVPEHNSVQEIAVHAIYGLGETLVGGGAMGDIAYIDRSHGGIVRKVQGTQTTKLVVSDDGLQECALEPAGKGHFCLPDDQLLELGRWARKIERLYGCAQDIEWAVTDDGALFILQARPLQQAEIATVREKESGLDKREQVLLVGGEKASGGTATGKVVVLSNKTEQQIEQGAVLVTRSTPPALVRYLNRIVAVVAEQGSTAGHFATVCREFGVPLLIGVADATKILHPGQLITVDADRRQVYAGSVAGICTDARGQPGRDLPYFRKLRAVMDFITPLNLLDPEGDDFRSDACRSLHDIIRYTHELAVRTMFSLGEKTGSRSKKRLQTDLPLAVNLLDVGGGLCPRSEHLESVVLVNICCRPFLALWQGLSHPGVDWQSHSHFDWKAFDEVTLAGGVVTKNSSAFASYAIIGQDYLNLNMRFGYHFTLVDALCGGDPRTNYCQIRFAGGGGEYAGRTLRLQFLETVLSRMGFTVTVKADLLDARLHEIDPKQLCKALDMLGRLLGATKLMDMVLKEEDDVARSVELFFKGQYTFTLAA